MSLIKWNDPMKLMGKRNWVENFFAETDDFLKNWNWDVSQDVPAVNVKDEKDFFMIDVAAPGMKREDFKVEVDRGVLIISATTEEKKEEKTENFKRQEFSYRNFKRSFWLPENIMPDKIEAHYEDGILKLKLPKMMEIPEKVQTIKVV
jgi:HSP20 family protein